jgi:AraC family transcriptional regulator, L-arginine-responsive activator
MLEDNGRQCPTRALPHALLVQVGLMCGFSSGSDFSTAYGTLFGITPREERQRKLLPGA